MGGKQDGEVQHCRGQEVSDQKVGGRLGGLCHRQKEEAEMLCQRHCPETAAMGDRLSSQSGSSTSGHHNGGGKMGSRRGRARPWNENDKEARGGDGDSKRQ